MRVVKKNSLFQSLFGDSGTAYLYALGIAAHGFYMFLIGLAVTSICYIILTYSFAEMVSIIPFSGGCYGYTRCTLGPTWGYVVGTVEAAKYMLFTILAAYSVGMILKYVFEFEDKWLPLLWLAYFTLINVAVVFGMKYLWWMWGLIALAMLMTQSIFLVGAVKYGETSNINGRFNELNTGHKSGEEFVQVLSFSLYLISGVDAMRTCANDRSNRVVPHAMVHIMIGTVIVAFLEVIAIRSYVLNPYKLLLYPFAFNVGLEKALPHVGSKYLPLFSLAGMFGNGYGFLYGGARQVRSMAGSGLLPAILTFSQSKEQVESEEQAVLPSKDKGEEDSHEKEIKPTMSLLVCSLFCYALLLVGFYEVDTFSRKVSPYCVFAVRFSNLERHLKSPFHIPGALIVIGYFITIFVSIFYYEDGSEDLGYSLVVFFVASMIYYIAVANKRQFFSKEEQDKFMKAYVMNANKRKKASSKKSAIHTFAERLSAMSGLTSVARGLKSMSASQDPDGRSVAPDRGGNGGRSVIIKANPRVVPVTEIRHAEST
eukprot:scaffold1881_cov181-Ochromonas_danica.AAC.18